MTLRVIDRQAHIDASTTNGEIEIAGKTYKRRLIEAPVLITLVQECLASIARDSWETEGDLRQIASNWVGVFVWGGDKKCSSATYWNTGNPRSLAESHAWVPISGASVEPQALYEFLAQRHRRSAYGDQGQPSSPWFEGSPDAIAPDIETFLARPRSTPKPARFRHAPAEPMVYLMQEAGTGWIKIGKCGEHSSPPAKRRSMYQPGNPREIIPIAAWTFDGSNPERRMIAALRKAAQIHAFSHRAEWFEIDKERIMTILADKMRDCTVVPIDKLGR